MPFDPDIASRFILAVPAGRWTTYGDVAEVGGEHDPMAAFRAGQWLAKSEGEIDNYWRVIDVDGRVPDEFHGGGLGPRTAEEARAWLRREGVPLNADDRAIGGRSTLGTGTTTPGRRSRRPSRSSDIAQTCLRISATCRHWRPTS